MQSSANSLALESTQFGKSLIKSRKSRGPLTGTLSEVAPSTTTCWFLDERNDLIQLYVVPQIP